MKLAAAAVLASCLPSISFALVVTSWSMTNVPSSGLKDITFPFSIAKAPHQSGFFFAQQFSFVDRSNSGVAYVGLQPRPDSNGMPIIRAVFSSFIPGTTTNDPNCTAGADGGPGVSCEVELSAPYEDTLSLSVVNLGGTTWTGTLLNTAGKSVRIGTWTLPAGTQGIQQSQSGFVEYYPWNAESRTCFSLHYTSVTMGPPTTSTSGAVGRLNGAFEYGDCVGKVNFKSSRTPLGVDVQVGFPGQ